MNDTFHTARELVAQFSGLPRPTVAESVRALRGYASEANLSELEVAEKICEGRRDVLQKGRFCAEGATLSNVVEWLSARRWSHEAPTAPGLYTWRLCHTWEPIEREVRVAAAHESFSGELIAFSSRVGKWVPLAQLVCRNNGGQWLVREDARNVPVKDVVFTP